MIAHIIFNFNFLLSQYTPFKRGACLCIHDWSGSFLVLITHNILIVIETCGISFSCQANTQYLKGGHVCLFVPYFLSVAKPETHFKRFFQSLGKRKFFAQNRNPRCGWFQIENALSVSIAINSNNSGWSNVGNDWKRYCNSALKLDLT